jgi:hypothetical protein
MLTGCDQSAVQEKVTALAKAQEQHTLVAPKQNGMNTSSPAMAEPSEEGNDKPVTSQTKNFPDTTIADGHSNQSQDRSGNQIKITPDVKKAGWYLRTMVSAVDSEGKRYEHKTAGVFGEYDQSSDGLDSHDIPSFGTAVLQVRFVNTNLSTDTAYFSDYRAFEGGERDHVWNFTVANETGADLSHADLKIELADKIFVLRKKGRSGFSEMKAKDQSIKERLKLVDVDNNKVYSYDELKNVTLNMDGKHVRSFQWVLGDTEDKVFKPMESKIGLHAFKDNRIQKNGANTALSSPSLKQSKFGTPPVL